MNNQKFVNVYFLGLIIATSVGAIDVLKEFLNVDADIEATDANGWTALHHATANGHFETVKLLHSYQANFTAITKKGENCVHLASGGGHSTVVDYLAANGCLVNERTNSVKKTTALHLAVENNHLDVVKSLLKHKVDLNLADETSRTAFHVATTGGHLEIFQLLISNGIQIDAYCPEGKSFCFEIF